MRITVRLIVALLVAASAVVAVSTYIQVRGEKARLVEDLSRRNSILAETLKEIAAPALAARDKARLARIVEKYSNRERVIGLAVYDARGEVLAFTPILASDLAAIKPVAERALAQAAASSKLLKDRFVDVAPILEPSLLGAIVLVRDASFIPARLSEVWRHNFFRLLGHALVISLVSLLIMRWNILAPIDQMTEWMKQLRAGGAGELPAASGGLLGPLASEASSLARSLSHARAAAEEEARLRHRSQSLWTAERLKEHAKERLRGRPMVVVANREPYIHVRRDGKVQIVRPASGLVSGVEPILKACGGTWVAHGTGDADRETVDAADRVRVPPEEPRYSLRRVWMTKEQEEGYYDGFSNEGLWPLCHIAHARPQFRAEDWKEYHAVNRLFADAVLSEIEGVDEPCVLIQDYHFALLPRMIKEARPDARISLFWHIPWPNPEAFGICPWQRDILDGMLGADVLGFHIQYHCNNFLETVDRALECRIDWEHFSIRRGAHSTLVKPYPISVALEENAGAPPSKEELMRSVGAKGSILALGVDRLDYTKGIIERFLAIERFLERTPAYIGRFVFVELGAPSRTSIPRYRELVEEVKKEADRINTRFASKDHKDWRPIALAVAHHERTEVARWYRVADLCVVTSLHDGMNLVAKEFVAADREEPGALVLSRFTGASRELRDALIVNPYDIDRVADALREAIEMGPEERRRRWQSMREAVRENNIYRWGARLVDDLGRVRLGDGDIPA